MGMKLEVPSVLLWVA